MQFGGQIRAAREAKGISQVRAAQLAGVSRRYLSELENDKANVSIGVLVKLASALTIKAIHFGSLQSELVATDTRVADKIAEARALLAEASKLIANPRLAQRVRTTAAKDLPETAPVVERDPVD
jgi:transcriptional regulator with XRE-family HTH domain